MRLHLVNLVWALLSAAPVFCQSITIDAGAPSDESPKYYICASACARYDITLLPNATGDLTLRFGSFTYRIPTLPGLFKVSLYMRETGTVTGNGQRKFTVKLNGQAVPSLTNFDLFAVANVTELQKDFIAVSNGEITLDFITVLRSAVVSRIVITPLPTLAVEAGFGLQMERDSADAISRRFVINQSVTMYRVPVPIPGSACNLGGAFAVDAEAQYFCVDGAWVAFPRGGGSAALPIAGPGITITQSPYTIAFNPAVLGGIYPTLTGGNLYAPGTQVFQASRDDGALRFVGGPRPLNPVGVTLHGNLSGELDLFNGSTWRTVVTK